MTPTYAVKNGVRYRYYISAGLNQGGKAKATDLSRVPAIEIEALIASAVRKRLGLDSTVHTGSKSMSDLLSYGEVQKLLKELPKEQGELVKDIVPSQINISGIQRVLQLLLAERISIRDLSTILEGIADALAFSRNPATLVEHVRARLARQICAQNTSMNGYLPLIALSAKWEQAFAESLIGQGDERSLAMQPSKLSEFMRWPRQQVRKVLSARTPRSSGAPTRLRECAGGGALR